MNIKKLTEILGKELSKEWVEGDEERKEGEFTVLDIVEATGWADSTVRRKVARMHAEGLVTRRGRRIIYFKASNTKTSK